MSATTQPAAPVPSVRRGVIAVIRDRLQRYLMIRRADGLLGAGYWCFPGGGIEPGETEASALRREVYEEIGIRVRPVRRVWTWECPDGGLVLYWWQVQRRSGPLVPNPAEVAEFRWLEREAILRLSPIFPNNLEFLRRA